MIKITLRSSKTTTKATEWVSLCILIGLALLSVAAAIDHIRMPIRQRATPLRTIARLTHVAATPGPKPEAREKIPEIAKNIEIVPPVRDIDTGEADRTNALPDTAVVMARQKDLPMLRDDVAFETWGGEFAAGDSRIKEMIQAGALTSVQKGAKVKILEVRGVLAHVEVLGQDRTGWIRSSFVGR